MDGYYDEISQQEAKVEDDTNATRKGKRKHSNATRKGKRKPRKKAESN